MLSQDSSTPQIVVQAPEQQAQSDLEKVCSVIEECSQVQSASTGTSNWELKYLWYILDEQKIFYVSPEVAGSNPAVVNFSLFIKIYLNPFASGIKKVLLYPITGLFSVKIQKKFLAIKNFSVNDTTSGQPNKRLIRWHFEN